MIAQDQTTGVMRYIETQFADLGVGPGLPVLRYLLHTGRCVIFFDGLDEILDLDMRDQVRVKIERFSHGFAPSPVVVTSREVGYDQQPLRGSWTELRISAFSVDEVNTYTNNLLSLITRKEENQVATLSERFMAESDKISDIRSNPLMLGVLVNLYSTGRSMPSNRIELYSKCAEMLFDEWDVTKGTVPIVQDQMATEQAVHELALHVFESGNEEFSLRWLETFLMDFYASNLTMHAAEAKRFARETMKVWRGRRWILAFAGDADGEDYVRFSHRTFLEFFAAEQLVYESSTGGDCWHRLKPLVTSQAAAPFCLLSSALLSHRTKGAGGELARLAMQDATEKLAQGELRPCLNIASFLAAAMSSMRLEFEVKVAIVKLFMDVFSRLIPFLDVSRLKQGRQLAAIGYVNVFGEPGELEFYDPLDLEASSDDDDELEEAFARGATIDDASGGLKSLESLRGSERSELSGAAEAYCLSLVDVPRDRARGLRLAMTLRQMPAFEGWVGSLREWREEPTEMAERIWRDIVKRRFGRADVDEDFWLMVELLRSQASADPSLVLAIGLEGLFTGGWPLPEVGAEQGTIAHTFCLTCGIGESEEGTFREWTDEELSALAGAIASLVRDAGERRRVATPSFDDFQKSQRRLRPDEPSRAGPPSPDEPISLAYLLAQLARFRDIEFVELALRRYETTPLGSTLRMLVNGVLYPGDWDEVEVGASALGMPEGDFQAVKWALGFD